MSRHDNTKRIFMVEKYHELKSSLQVIESWKKEYQNDKPPTADPVLYNVKKFHQNGRMNELARPHTKISKKNWKTKNETEWDFGPCQEESVNKHNYLRMPKNFSFRGTTR